MFQQDTVPGMNPAGMLVEGVPCYSGYTTVFFGKEHQIRSYTGECQGSHLHGHGRVVYGSGSVYNGTFKLSKQHGVGLFFEPKQKFYYVGGWADGVQHGSAFVFAADRSVVARSEWNHGQQMSAAAATWADLEAGLGGQLREDEEEDAAMHFHVAGAVGGGGAKEEL